MSESLAALADMAAGNGEAAALITGSMRLSAEATLRSVEQVTEQLVCNRVRILAIAADNSPDWVIADLAARRARIPVVPLPPFFSPEQVAHVLFDSGADSIAADEIGSPSLMSLPTRFSAELTVKLTLLRLERAGVGSAVPPGTAKISYTSGTTGTPRGVCLTQEAMDRVARGLCEVTADLGIKRHLCLLPLATLLENIAGVHAPIMAGADVVLPPLEAVGTFGACGHDVTRLVASLRAFEPSSIILLPQLLAGLVAAVEQGAALPESLRFAAVGGGVVGLPLLDRAEKAGIPVYEGYGLTECCSVVALNTPSAKRLGTVGQPLPHCRVRIGADSEVLVDGACMAGYLGAGNARTAEIATGDVGYLDRDGYLCVTGRKKNVLITSFGRNLSPEWVEGSLTATPSIAQAALFGDGMPFNVAVIVPVADVKAEAIEGDVSDVNAWLPDYARVERWILATERFAPMNGMATSNGRIRRAAIERRYREEIDACYADAIESYA